ncbi:MAG: MBL fold metallo-hydrolase [Deltaproteobacteria bacterium]|nr:MBL fold metallo-hydrolase [Deltaproteobacteria bacterium]
MKVTALGTGDAFSADRYSSCLLVEEGDTRLLIDCPHPIRKILKESTKGRVDVGDIDGLILTHLHADHASGVEGYAWFCRFALKKTARIYAHAAVLEHLWGQVAGSMSELLHVDEDNKPHHRSRLQASDVFDCVPLTSPMTIGDLTVESRLTIHHIPTTALFFRGAPSVSATAGTFGYSADTAFDEDLIAWLGRADLLLHETNFGAHTPYAKLAALPAELRAKMRLIHWPDGFDVGHDGAIAVLHDGDTLSIP